MVSFNTTLSDSGTYTDFVDLLKDDTAFLDAAKSQKKNKPIGKMKQFENNSCSWYRYSNKTNLT